MNRFEVITPATLAKSVELLSQPGNSALAGGVDTIDLLKQNLAAPAALINLKGLKELNGIENLSDGSLRIGALVTLSELSAHPAIAGRYAALAQAAGEAATPQIRNLATIGGNLLQRPRCWYFRNSAVNCLKKGGEKCYAIGGLNRYHSILGGGPSYIVHPSNLAPALIALRASVRITGSSGERTIPLDGFFTLPTVDPHRENSLRSGEVITAIVLPPDRGYRSVYLEVREKQSFDWPLVSVAVMIANSKAPAEVSIVMGAVAPIPWRAAEAEQLLKGRPITRQLADAAAASALKNAQPMSDNAYKVEIAKVLIRRAVLRAAAVETT